MSNSMKYHDKFTNNKNYNEQLYIEEDPIGEITDETDPKQTHEEGYDDEGNQEADEQEDNDS